MWFVSRCLRQRSRISFLRIARTYRDSHHDTDSCGIPVRPSWSVNTLLSSYPTPTISSATLLHLHELSALIPPPTGTQEHVILRQEVEDLVRLVEAVKLVDTKDVHFNGPRDEQSSVQQHNNQQFSKCQKRDSGRALLSHALRSLDGFYVVDADRKRFYSCWVR
jgi:hypothetical protein